MGDGMGKGLDIISGLLSRSLAGNVESNDPLFREDDEPVGPDGSVWVAICVEMHL